MNPDSFLDHQKELFLAYLLKIIPQEAYLNSPAITQRDYADNIYTDIMSLGYNFGDINKAADDRMEVTPDFSFLGVTKKSIGTMRNEIKETAGLYASAVKVFSQAHLNFQSGKSQEDTLVYIEQKLNGLIE